MLYIGLTNDEKDRKARWYVLSQITPRNSTHNHTTQPLHPQKNKIDISPGSSFPRLNCLADSFSATEDGHAEGETPSDAGDVHVIAARFVEFVGIR